MGLIDFDFRPELNAAIPDLDEVGTRAKYFLRKANNPAKLFRNAGGIVELSRDGTMFLPVSVHRMNQILAEEIDWFKLKDGERKSARPPRDLAATLLADPNFDLPWIERIVTTPTFGADGTLQDTPGYYPAERKYFAPKHADQFMPVSRNPSDEELAGAVDLVGREIFGEFDFSGQSDLAHLFSAVILPFVRDMISGPSPIHLIHKPIHGAGATLIAQIIVEIADGRVAAVNTESKSDDEYSRKLLSILRKCPSIVLFDNLRQLKNGSLAACVTSGVFEERKVGTSETCRVPVHCLFLATANNPKISPEFARRCVSIRLKPKTAHPELRTDFKHPYLLEFVRENRETFVHAVCTVVQGWIAAGCPKAKVSLGQFEQYSAVVGGILNFAGVTGFLGNQNDLRESEDDDEGLAELICIWAESEYRNKPALAKQLVEMLNEFSSSRDWNPTELGRFLRDNRERIVRGHRIDSAGDLRGLKLWKLTPISDPEER